MKRESLLFGEELRRRCLTAGLTVTQLAARVHYSKSQISKVERGMNRRAATWRGCVTQCSMLKAPLLHSSSRCPLKLGSHLRSLEQWLRETGARSG